MSLLQTSTNDLRILNVGDTGVSSRVLLDRFEIAYPQTSAARSGALRGPLLLRGNRRGRRARLARRSRRRHLGLLAHRVRNGVFAALPRRGRPPLPRRLRGSPSLAPRLLPPAVRSPAPHGEPGRLPPHRPTGFLRRRTASPRPESLTGPHDLRRLPRGDHLLLRCGSAFRGGSARLPLLRLPPLDKAFSPLRPSPRRLQLRPSPLQCLLPALASALSPPEDLLHVDRVRPRSRRPQRGRPASRYRHRTASRHHPRAGPEPRRQDPRLGGPGTEPRRQGRPRRRQPRPRRGTSRPTSATSRPRSSPDATRPRSSTARSGTRRSLAPRSSTP